MCRACLSVFLAVLLGPPAAAFGQAAAFDDALGHAMQRYYASNLDEAQTELSQLIGLGYADPRLYYFRGLCAWQSGRTADAARDFARGAELEQAGAEHSAEISSALTRVQGPARRSLEGYRSSVRLALLRQRDARRLAHYGLGTSQPPANALAAAATPGTAQQSTGRQPAAALPEPTLAATVPPAAGQPAADDPFAAPPAGNTPASPAADPFAAPPSEPASPPPAAAVTPPAAIAPLAAIAPPADVTPPAAVDAVPAAADTSTPEGTIAAALAALEKPENLWPLLPTQHQADIKGLINQFGAKMDAELWDRAFVVLNKLVRVGKEKREMILKQPALAAVPLPGGKEQLIENWDRMMEFAGTLLGSEVSTVEGIKTLDPPAFLAGTGSKLVKLAVESSPPAAAPSGEVTLAKLKAAKITTVKADGETATMLVDVVGKRPLEFTLKRVDGKWLPSAMVDGWAEKVAAAKLSLDQMNVAAQKPQAMAMLQMGEGVLDQLLAAKDEAAFNAALAPIMALLGQFVPKPPDAAPAP